MVVDRHTKVDHASVWMVSYMFGYDSNITLNIRQKIITKEMPKLAPFLPLQTSATLHPHRRHFRACAVSSTRSRHAQRSRLWDQSTAWQSHPEPLNDGGVSWLVRTRVMAAPMGAWIGHQRHGELGMGRVGCSWCERERGAATEKKIGLFLLCFQVYGESHSAQNFAQKPTN